YLRPNIPLARSTCELDYFLGLMTPFLNDKPLRSIYNTRLKEPATPVPLPLDLQCTIIQPVK
ncbi:hypothetical protein ILYODFUR_031402, partial [Ilyodon furcidens]